MKCDECLELLTSLVFGEISEDQEFSIHEHLADCDSCRDAYIEMLDTKSQLESGILDDFEEEGLSVEQKKEIISVINTSDVKKAPLIIPSWVFALAACLVIAVIVGVNMDSTSPSMAQSEKAKIEAGSLLMEDAEAEADDQMVVEQKQIVEKAGESLELNSEIAVDRKMLKKAVKLDALKEEVSKTENKRQLSKSKDAAKKVAPAAQMLSDVAVGFSAPTNLKMDVPAFRKMLEATSKNKSNVEGLEALKKVIEPLENKQIQLQLLPADKGTKNAPEKILIRILNNDQKAIDYAHIFVHNQIIIQVERVE